MTKRKCGNELKVGHVQQQAEYCKLKAKSRDFEHMTPKC